MVDARRRELRHLRALYFTRGYTVHDERFLRALSESHHEIWYLALEGGPGETQRPTLPTKVRAAGWPPGRPALRTPRGFVQLPPYLRRVLAKVEPDLVHAGPVPTSAFVTARTGFRPLAAMSWGSDLLLDADRDGLWRRRARYALDRSDLLFCDCAAVRAKARDLVGFPDGRVVQFPWGIDLDRFRPEGERLPWRERPGWRDATILVATRSWEPGYGIETLLDSFRIAVGRNPELRLVLVGSGPLRPWVENFLHRAGLASHVLLPGAVDHDALPPFFRSADLYVACTPSDGSSVSLLEALGSGLPAVVTDNPGNREWIVPDRNGWLAPADRPEAFAECIAQAAQMPDTARQGMSAANRALAEARADWKKNKEILLAAYDRIETERPGRPARLA